MSRSESRRDKLAPLCGSNPVQYPQRRPRSPFHPVGDPAATVAPTPTPTPHHHRRKASPQSQTALLRAASPPLLFAILIAGLLIELRVRLLASPTLPEATTTNQLPILPGVAVSTHGNTAMQRALIWAESRWPGLWALPALCVAAVGALRAAIWAGAAVLERFEERVNASSDAAAARVRIGRWEDGGSVSGSELLAGMFT